MEDVNLDYKEIIASKKIPLLLGFFGLLFLIIGFFVISLSNKSEDKIEIIPAAQEAASKIILADIEGAVVKPGVYELSLGSRVNDLLIMAGGLSAKADRNWVETNLNKAQKLKDGDKVYIPLEGESSSTKATEDKSSTTISSKININSATLTELDTLWGVGQITAQKIIDNRPYQKIEDLVSKKVIPQSTFQKISNKLSVY